MKTTVEQSMTALGIANAVRFARAELRREVGAGTTSLESVLLGLDDRPLGHTTVSTVLTWQHNIGPARARQAMRHAGIIGDPRVCDLTKRQRLALVLAMR